MNNTKALILLCFFGLTAHAQHSDVSQAPEGFHPVEFWAPAPIKINFFLRPDDLGVQAFDWQVEYKITDNQLEIGRVVIGRQDKAWRQIKSDCSSQSAQEAGLEDGIAGDQTAIRYCPPNRPLPRGLQKPESSDQLTLWIQNQIVEPKGEVAIISGAPVTWIARWPDGAWIELKFQLPIWRWWFGAESEKHKMFKLTFDRPGDQIVVDRDFFSPSYPIDQRLEEVRLRTETPILFRETVKGIQLRRLFENADKLPSKLPFPRTVEKTYLESPAVVKDGTRQHVGLLPLAKRSWVKTASGETFSIVRMPAGEINARLAALSIGDSGYLLTGEASLLYNHENLFSSNPNSFHRHRWGWGFNTYQTLASSDRDGTLADVKASLLSFEARGLITPGLWNYDEVFGLIASANQLRQGLLSAGAMGIGVFWGAPLHFGVAKWFDRISWLSHPKYIDATIRYAPLHISGANLSKPFLKVDLHGKMIINSRWFVEGGIGYLDYEIRESRNVQGLSSFTGNIGAGLFL